MQAQGSRCTVDRLRQWVRAAQPNARLTYGHGPNASSCCSAELRDYVMELSRAGYVTPHRLNLKGEGGEVEPVQIVQRTHRPVLQGAEL